MLEQPIIVVIAIFMGVFLLCTGWELLKSFYIVFQDSIDSRQIVDSEQQTEREADNECSEDTNRTRSEHRRDKS